MKYLIMALIMAFTTALTILMGLIHLDLPTTLFLGLTLPIEVCATFSFFLMYYTYKSTKNRR